MAHLPRGAMFCVVKCDMYGKGGAMPTPHELYIGEGIEGLVYREPLERPLEG